MSNFTWKIDFLKRFPEKIEIFRKFVWKNLNLFYPDLRPPDLKPDWHRCELYTRRLPLRDLLVSAIESWLGGGLVIIKFWHLLGWTRR